MYLIPQRAAAAKLGALLLVIMCLSCALAANVINIAALVTDPNVENGPESLYIHESRAQIRGWKLWVETANKAGGVVVNNVTYSFNLTIVNVGYTSEKAANVTKSVLAGDFGTFDLFFGPYSSGLTTSVALQLEAADTVMLTAGATSSSIYSCAGAGTLPNCKFSGQRRFQNTWGTLSIAERYYSSILALLRNRGARNIAVWAEAAAFPQSIKNGVKAEAANQRMNITFEKNIPDSPNATILSDLIDELSQRPDVDAVIAGTYYDTSVSFVRLAKQKNWVPKALVTRIGEVSIYRDLGDDARYLMDSNYWDSRLHGDDYIDSLYFSDPSVPAPLQFANAFQAKWGELPGQNYEAVAFANGEILHEAIRRAQSFSAASVRSAMAQLSFTTFLGKISFNALGYNELLPFTATQRDENNDIQILAPLIASTDDIVYPMPTWSERAQQLVAYQNAAEKTIVSLAGILMAGCLALGTFVIYHSRSHRVIIASSPLFLLMMLLGALIMYVGVILWSLYNTDVVCNATAWCIGIGFIVLFGSLFGRTFRILQIITKSKFRPVKFTNTRLFFFVGILVGIELVVLVLWTSISPINFIFLGILGFYKLLVLAAGVVFSIRIWNFHLEAFNESRQIAFSMYNLVFFAVLAIIAVASLNQESQLVAAYTLRSVAMLLAITITILVMFIPKVVMTLRTPAQQPARVQPITTSGSKTTGLTTGSKPTMSSYTNSSVSEQDLEAQLRIAKAQVNALHEKIEELVAQNKRLRAATAKSKGGDPEASHESVATELSDKTNDDVEMKETKRQKTKSKREESSKSKQSKLPTTTETDILSQATESSDSE